MNESTRRHAMQVCKCMNVDAPLEADELAHREQQSGAEAKRALKLLAPDVEEPVLQLKRLAHLFKRRRHIFLSKNGKYFVQNPTIKRSYIQ